MVERELSTSKRNVTQVGQHSGKTDGQESGGWKGDGEKKESALSRVHFHVAFIQS